MFEDIIPTFSCIFWRNVRKP